MNDDTLTSVSGSDADVNLDSGETSTVSSGDAVSSGNAFCDFTDSSSDTFENETIVEIPDNFYNDLLTQLKGINYILSALLFFTIFKWVETKVRAIVRKVMWHE